MKHWKPILFCGVPLIAIICTLYAHLAHDRQDAVLNSQSVLHREDLTVSPIPAPSAADSSTIIASDRQRRFRDDLQGILTQYKGVDALAKIRHLAVNGSQGLGLKDALSMMEIIDNPNYYRTAIKAVIAARGFENSAALLDWYKQASLNPHFDGGVTSVVARTLAASGKLTLEGIAGCFSNETFATHFFEMLGRSSPDSAREYLNTEAVLTNDHCLAGGITGLSKAGQYRDASLMLPRIGDDTLKNITATTLAFEWAKMDSTGVSAWLGENLNNQALSAQIASGLVAGWYQHNSLECSIWVKGLSPGATKDSAIASLVRMLAHTAGGDASAWAAQIQDATLRQQSLAVINP